MDLLRAIRTVADDGALMSPSVTRSPVREFVTLQPRPRRPHPFLHTLTDRERETLILAAEGLADDEIGRQLGISTATARTHVSRAMLKLGPRDRAQLVVFAYQSGIVA